MSSRGLEKYSGCIAYCHVQSGVTVYIWRTCSCCCWSPTPSTGGVDNGVGATTTLASQVVAPPPWIMAFVPWPFCALDEVLLVPASFTAMSPSCNSELCSCCQPPLWPSAPLGGVAADLVRLPPVVSTTVSALPPPRRLKWLDLRRLSWP